MSKVTYPQIIQVCKVCEGERRGGEGVCKSSAKAGRQVGQFVCLLMTIFLDMVMVIVDVLCYAYAAVYLKCILVKVITLSKRVMGDERQGPKR